jgi:LytS/YehU family sensor histidine kinase
VCGLLLAFACVAQAQEAGSIYPALKVGSSGHFKKDKDTYLSLRVVKVVAINAVIVKGKKGASFVVSGISTKDLADDETIELKGEYKVMGTIKLMDTTYKSVKKIKD